MKRNTAIIIFFLLSVGRLSAAQSLPKPLQISQANGMTVLLHQDGELPLVSFRLLIPGAGSAYETADGLADLTAQLLLKGTAAKTAAQIAEELDRLGVTLKCSAQDEFLEIAGSALPKTSAACWP